MRWPSGLLPLVSEAARKLELATQRLGATGDDGIVSAEGLGPARGKTA